MPSLTGPLPGLDPWIERHWADVHASLITYAKESLNLLLPQGLVAPVEERVYLVPIDVDSSFQPDVYVSESAADPSETSTATLTRCQSPCETIAIRRPITMRSLQIIDARRRRRVVPTLEILSPSNKCAGQTRKHYLTMQRRMLESDTNLVEIDLLRQGRRTTVASRNGGTFAPTGPHVSVWRTRDPDRTGLCRIASRQPLPAIDVPLRASDAEISLDLQALLGRVYASSRYDQTIDYTQPPDPPLPDDDAAWARSCVDAWRTASQSTCTCAGCWPTKAAGSTSPAAGSCSARSRPAPIPPRSSSPAWARPTTRSVTRSNPALPRSTSNPKRRSRTSIASRAN
jgi:hypothetical protein